MEIRAIGPSVKPAGFHKTGWGRVGRWFSAAATAGALLSGCGHSERIKNVSCSLGGNLKEMETSEGRFLGGEILRLYEFDVYGMPESVLVSDGKRRIAEASRVETSLTEKDGSDPDFFKIEVAEKHYSGNGLVEYEGRLHFLAPRMGMGVRDMGMGLSKRVGEEKISGERPIDLFQKWPGVALPSVPCLMGRMF